MAANRRRGSGLLSANDLAEPSLPECSFPELSLPEPCLLARSEVGYRAGVLPLGHCFVKAGFGHGLCPVDPPNASSRSRVNHEKLTVSVDFTTTASKLPTKEY